MVTGAEPDGAVVGDAPSSLLLLLPHAATPAVSAPTTTHVAANLNFERCIPILFRKGPDIPTLIVSRPAHKRVSRCGRGMSTPCRDGRRYHEASDHPRCSALLDRSASMDGVLMQIRFRGGVSSGAVTLTFRRWKRPQVVAGRTYRTAAGRIVVDAIDVVDPARITTADARRAGFATRAELLAELRGTDDLPTYRIRFHAADGPDPRAELAADGALDAAEVEAIRGRLDRLDRAGSQGPWTIAV